MKESVTLISGDKVGFETDYRDALPVNMYVVQRPILGADGYLMTYPGLSSVATGEGKDRGGIYNERFSEQYRVSGGRFIRVNNDGTITDIGAISGTNQVALPYSFDNQCIITDDRMWLYNPTDGLVEVVDVDLGDPIDGVWVDNYFFMVDPEWLFHTERGVDTSIDPSAYGTAEFSPDPNKGVSLTPDNKVIVWGRYSCEYFIFDSTTNFAFSRVETRAQKIGIVATHAKCEAGSLFYFCGGRKEDSVFIYELGIGSSLKVSTREVDKILAAYTEPELADMRMESRMEDNIQFVIVHLPNETLCLNVNIATAMGKELAWTILKTDVQGDSTYRGINGVYDANLGYWVYGDKRDTHIGKLDKDISTHYGDITEWLIYSPFMDLDSYTVDEIEITTIPGHTAVDDATVAFSTTSDGVAYSTEYWMQYGASYNYGQRFILRRGVGYVRDWIGFKFRGVTTSRMAYALMRVTYG